MESGYFGSQTFLLFMYLLNSFNKNYWILGNVISSQDKTVYKTESVPYWNLTSYLPRHIISK